MKRLLNILAILILVITFSFNANAQKDGPPPVGSGPESGDAPIGGNAPVGTGMVVLLALGTFYAGKKAYAILKDEKKEES